MYEHKNYICPYFRHIYNNKMRCEGCVLLSNIEDVYEDYQNEFCNSYNWKNCSIARKLNIYYEGRK